METLLIILGVLFVALVIVVLVAQRFGRPLEPGEQQKLSRWIILLVGLLLVAQVLRHYLGGG